MALAFLVSCLISAASFHDRTWRVFMTNSTLNCSDMLSSLLPSPSSGTRLVGFFCSMPTVGPTWPPCHGDGLTVRAEGERPQMPEYSLLYPNWLLQGTNSHCSTKLCTLVFAASALASKTPHSLAKRRGYCLSSLLAGLHGALPADY